MTLVRVSSANSHILALGTLWQFCNCIWIRRNLLDCRTAENIDPASPWATGQSLGVPRISTHPLANFAHTPQGVSRCLVVYRGMKMIERHTAQFITFPLWITLSTSSLFKSPRLIPSQTNSVIQAVRQNFPLPTTVLW